MRKSLVQTTMCEGKYPYSSKKEAQEELEWWANCDIYVCQDRLRVYKCPLSKGKAHFHIGHKI